MNELFLEMVAVAAGLERILTIPQTRPEWETKNALKKHRMTIKDAVRKLIREDA